MELVRRTFRAFDTVVDIALAPVADAEAALDEAERRCAFFEQTFSRFRPQSDVGRINAAAGAAVEVQPETARLIHASLGYCAASGGAFDITMAPVCALWDFKRAAVPDPSDLREALSHVDYRCIELGGTDVAPTVKLDDPQAAIDLGGVAKGFIADDLAALLRHRGIGSALINLGGNVLAVGTRLDGQPWQVGIRDPRHPDRLIASLPAVDLSVVTSGCYERCFERDGQLYHHILSAHDGMPVDTDVASATVLSRASLDGDGFSTTLLMLGVVSALEFGEARDGIEVLLVDSSGGVHATSGIGMV